MLRAGIRESCKSELRLSSCSIVPGNFQSGGHRPQQLSFFQRLAQESHRASIERERFGSLFRESCEENHWDAASVGQQVLLQVKPAHTRHLQISDEERGVGYFTGFQKASSRLVRPDLVPDRCD